jgi:RNA exonuclease NGL2
MSPGIHTLVDDIRYPCSYYLTKEVDRMEKLAPALKDVGFEYIYASGVNKKHGCVIAFQQAEYRPETHKIIYYDDELADGSKHALSFKTRNIGLIVALRGGGAPGGGIILATTHLFWHPCYYYERTRYELFRTCYSRF